MSQSPSFPATPATPRTPALPRARLLLRLKSLRNSPRKSALFAAVFLLSACHASAPHAAGATLQLTSSSFAHGVIPPAYTCDGVDASPQLSWSQPPRGTRFLALTVVDPDAPSGAFTHWVLFNLPATTRSLPEDFSASAQLPSGAAQGINSFQRIGYGGPCPPPGSTHRYVFTLYAVDSPLPLDPGVTRPQLEAALAGHILAQAHLTARYGR